jgi:hypothetical protein
MNFFGIPDPFNLAYQSTATGWGTAMSAITQRLYLSLLILEVIILGVQSLFFKDSVLEYIKNFASKVMLATLAIAVIANANVIFPQAISIVTATAAQVTGVPAVQANAQASASCQQGMRWTCVPPGPPGSGDVEGTMIQWAAYYFIAADLSRVADSAEGIVSSIMFGIPFPPDPGNGDPGISIAFIMGHGQFQLFCFAMGMLCLLSAAGVYLTYVLLTFETQVVMAIGIIVMAGFGSRFTQQFAKAFPKYCMTIGTKFFAYYFVVAVVQQLLDSVNNSFTGQAGFLAGLITGAIVPFGAGAIVLVVASSPAPILSMISAVLIAAIPGFAASLTTGQSAMSASAASGQIAGSFSKG